MKINKFHSKYIYIINICIKADKLSTYLHFYNCDIKILFHPIDSSYKIESVQSPQKHQYPISTDWA